MPFVANIDMKLKLENLKFEKVYKQTRRLIAAYLLIRRLSGRYCS